MKTIQNFKNTRTNTVQIIDNMVTVYLIVVLIKDGLLGDQ